MKKKKIEIKWKNIFLLLILLLGSIGLIYSAINLIKWKFDSKKTDEQINKVQEKIIIEEKEDTENTIIIEQNEEVPKANPYWDYIKMNLIDVNFDNLKSINNQTKGWIQVIGTNINYPFVQTSDNKYYLTHTYDKSFNNAGWIFLDYRNNINELGKNTIIYGHSRLDKTMFGSLKNILSSGWLNDTNNYVIKLSTEKENTLWQVFSVYHIPTTSDYIKTDFNSNEEFKNFADMLINRSAHNFNTSVSNTDRVLTLSTCYNENNKVVLHAKLIKREGR